MNISNVCLCKESNVVRHIDNPKRLAKRPKKIPYKDIYFSGNLEMFTDIFYENTK